MYLCFTVLGLDTIRLSMDVDLPVDPLTMPTTHSVLQSSASTPHPAVRPSHPTAPTDLTVLRHAATTVHLAWQPSVITGHATSPVDRAILGEYRGQTTSPVNNAILGDSPVWISLQEVRLGYLAKD